MNDKVLKTIYHSIYISTIKDRKPRQITTGIVEWDGECKLRCMNMRWTTKAETTVVG